VVWSGTTSDDALVRAAATVTCRIVYSWAERGLTCRGSRG
jgi:hypothetical protein